jgi:hypothetical protein
MKTELNNIAGSGSGEPPWSIFELVDTTCDEAYYTMGLLLSLEEAIAEATKPSRSGGPRTEVNDDYVEFEIRERKIGFSGYSVTGKVRATVRWEYKYSDDDEDDDGKWHVSISNAVTTDGRERSE